MQPLAASSGLMRPTIWSSFTAALQIDSRPGMGTTCRSGLPRGDAEAPSRRPRSIPVRRPGALDPLLDGVLQHGSDIVQCGGLHLGELRRPSHARGGRTAWASLNYVSRIFRRETGMTPWQYLTRYRVAQAQRLPRRQQLQHHRDRQPGRHHRSGVLQLRLPQGDANRPSSIARAAVMGRWETCLVKIND
ncbi:MAG: hypothetical protein R2838_10640 [Caldilineaceae bacterium]